MNCAKSPKLWRCADRINPRVYAIAVGFRRRDADGCDRDGRAPLSLEPVWKLRGALFSGKRPDGATREALRAATTEQLRKHSRAGRSQTAFSPKTLRAAGLWSVAGVG